MWLRNIISSFLISLYYDLSQIFLLETYSTFHQSLGIIKLVFTIKTNLHLSFLLDKTKTSEHVQQCINMSYNNLSRLKVMNIENLYLLISVQAKRRVEKGTIKKGVHQQGWAIKCRTKFLRVWNWLELSFHCLYDHLKM